MPLICHFAKIDDWCTPAKVNEVEAALKQSKSQFELYSESRRNKSFLPLDDALSDVKPRKPVPHDGLVSARVIFRQSSMDATKSEGRSCSRSVENLVSPWNGYSQAWSSRGWPSLNGACD